MTPVRRRLPRSASRASGRPPLAGGSGWPRIVPPALRVRPSIPSLRFVLSEELREPDLISVTHVLIHRSHLFVSFRHRKDEQNPADVTGGVVNPAWNSEGSEE